MRTKPIFTIMTILMITSLIISACGTDGPTDDELANAVELTLAALPTDTEVPPEPTETPEPTEPPAPTNTPEPTAIPHETIPVDFPEDVSSQITDPDSSASAAEASAAIGEAFAYNLYERPFTEGDMTYRPDLDITGAKLGFGDSFTYVEVKLQGQHPDGGLLGTYGVELDSNNDGRGDVLVLASNVQSEWSTDGVFAWSDSNSDVGGETPITADDQPGSGYDNVVFEESLNGGDIDLVWARVSPNDANAVQLAFKPDLIGNAMNYVWWAVADAKVMNPAWYDYNDHFTLEEAGSPIAGKLEYPVKALSEIDNTCSWYVGAVPEALNARMCGGIASLLESGQPEEVTVQVFPTADCSGPSLSFNTVILPAVNFAGVAAGVHCVRVLGLECEAGVSAQVITFPLDGDFDWGAFCEPD